MVLPKPSPRIRKRKPLTSRLALEPLEDRTLPSANLLGAQPIHFTPDAIRRLDVFLNTTFIQTSEVADVTTGELWLFGNQPAPAGSADQRLLDSILTKLHYVDSHDQVSLAFGVGLRADIDAFVADNPQLNVPLNYLITHAHAPQVTLQLASVIQTTLGGTPGSDTDVPTSVPFSFLVDMVRLARGITGDSFTSLDLQRATGEINEVNTFEFTAPANGHLLLRIGPQDAMDSEKFQGRLTLFDEFDKVIADRTSEDGQLEVNVSVGQSYFLRASPTGTAGEYTLVFALVFGGPLLDSIGSLIARGPDTAVTPAFQQAPAFSPGSSLELAAQLAAQSIGTPPADGGGDDAAVNPPDPTPLPPERQMPPGLVPGGVDELLKQYRPKVSLRSEVGPATNDSAGLQPIVEPDDVLDQPALLPGIDLPDSPIPLAEAAEIPHSPASVAAAPITDRSVVDSAFSAWSNPPATEEADLDAFAQASGARVAIEELPNFASVVSSVAIAVLAQGGLLIALRRPVSEPVDSPPS